MSSSTTETTQQTLSESEEYPPHVANSDTSSLAVEYQWSKSKIHITHPDKPNELVYIASYGLTGLTFKRVADDEIIGKGINHAISINSDYEVNGRKSSLRAAKRMHTEYTHLSYALADSPDRPVAMTWKTKADLKNWDFICVDEQAQPVARFHSNVWYLKKIGTVEFLGARAQSEEAQREILVVGLTLYNQMLIRINNPLNLLGSLAKPKPFKAAGEIEGGEEGEGENVEMQTEGFKTT